MSNRWYVNPHMLRRSEMGGDVAVVLEVHLAEALRQAANNQAGDAAVTGYDRGYEQGQKDEREKHHTHYCCAMCDYHVMPHRRCILR
jgi:hypothetical protein